MIEKIVGAIVPYIQNVIGGEYTAVETVVLIFMLLGIAAFGVAILSDFMLAILIIGKDIMGRYHRKISKDEIQKEEQFDD